MHIFELEKLLCKIVISDEKIKMISIFPMETSYKCYYFLNELLTSLPSYAVLSGIRYGRNSGKSLQSHSNAEVIALKAQT